MTTDLLADLDDEPTHQPHDPTCALGDGGCYWRGCCDVCGEPWPCPESIEALSGLETRP